MSVIAALDRPDRLFYCDPPYVLETWTRSDKSYTNVLTDDDHRDLARALNECRAKVAISGYDSALYTDLYRTGEWRKILAPPQISHASKRFRQEVLWCNYGEDGRRLRPTMVKGAALEIPTSAKAEVDALVSEVSLAAINAWKARGRQHKLLHAFLGGAYRLAAKLRDDEAEFGRVMRAQGIKRPKLKHLYYQVVQAFQPQKLRADPDMKSEASRLKRAFIQAEALGYTPEDFVRRIERKEVVAGRKRSGVSKLIKLARLSRSPQKPKPTAEAVLGLGTVTTESGASSIDLSGYLATMLNKALPVHERLSAMEAAADAAEKARVSPDTIRVGVSASSGEVTTHALVAVPERPEPGRSHRKARPSGKARNSFDILSRPAKLLAWNHPAMTERRTVYPSTVVVPSAKRVLIEGVNNAKTGPGFLIGPWTGLPIYTLTLEERATCSAGCEHWRSCMGNNMHWAQRLQPGPALEQAIRRDVAKLTTKHPEGIAVRLHVLGDFYSPAYVQLWAELMRQHVTLRVFGFTRRWDVGDPIAEAVRELAQEQP